MGLAQPAMLRITFLSHSTSGRGGEPDLAASSPDPAPRRASPTPHCRIQAGEGHDVASVDPDSKRGTMRPRARSGGILAGSGVGEGWHERGGGAVGSRRGRGGGEAPPVLVEGE